MKHTRTGVVWTIGAVIAAIAIWFAVAPKSHISNESNRVEPAESAELRAQIARLEMDLSRMKEGFAFSPEARTESPVEQKVIALAVEREQRVPSEDLSEEELDLRSREQADQRHLFFEKRFADEAVDQTWSLAEQQEFRKRIEGREGNEVLNLECRYTMCRMELKSAASRVPELIPMLGLEHGGEIRRRDDGTFLVFSGREGFPFHEVNQPPS
jgi:hypothetical protein